MKILIDNANTTLCWGLNVLRWVGFVVPDKLFGAKKMLLSFYSCFWFINVGIYIITQTGDLIQVWGDLSLMTDTSFLLFTNFAFTTKIINVMIRRDKIQTIVDEGDAVLASEESEEGRVIVKRSNIETTRLLASYVIFAAVTVLGWAASAEKGSLPLRAWYPYDLSNSPAYELTYVYQSVTVVLMAMINVSLDILVTSLTAVCRCRLKLLALSLKTLSHDIKVTDKHLLTPEDDKRVAARLRHCVIQHKTTLESAVQIQTCFTVPILAQFTVSMVIICVTAYQLAVETQANNIRLISMTAYLIAMILQVYIYCYQGTYLSEESMEVADAAYECLWYACSHPIKRSLLIMMVRSKSALVLTAGGFTTLSLDCFVSIIKASYSFFTVLQQMEE